ncbi:DNA-binding protein YbaB [Streptosporangium album]|uniref:DNA-binding protein YbaB n=1 Tax=Streptosporangium album TaxID=47479 RepID=A0A7W7W8F5_9ACTN|nr:YbaB/EbfC family nucleoid-associated protein [Streptosporangium album]MBB4937756.1 DNA-binding protein YbaB [Streptosporangium album]
MPPTPASNDELRHLEQIMEQAQEVMRKFQEAQTAILEVTGAGEGADGLVRAVSDGRGGIMEIDFNPRAMRLDCATLGREVTTALQAAQQEAERRSQEIMGEALASAEAMPEPLDETFVRDRVEQAARDLFS